MENLIMTDPQSDTPDNQDACESKGLRQQVREIIDYDDERVSAPQEHLVTVLAAVGFAMCALRAPTRTAVVLHSMVSGALLYRAASGRDGLRRWVGARPARPAEPGRDDSAPRATDWRTSGPLASDPQ
jgi:hypothetical protein